MNEVRLNGYHIYHSFVSGFLSIETQREYMNSINVFPVADGDTGNNLVRTVKLIAGKLVSQRSASGVLEQMASLSLESARGNSGLIFSQYLNGLALNSGGRNDLSIREFAAVASQSVDMAYGAVEDPAEGTILTILRTWSDSLLQFCSQNIPGGQVFEKAYNSVCLGLARTKEQLEILKENDVVDAGAYGIVSFLEGIEVLRKRGPAGPSRIRELQVRESVALFDSHSAQHSVSEALSYRYCTEFLLDHRKDRRALARQEISDLGDSLIVSRGRGRSRIHIHTNHPERVLEKLKPFGTVIEQKVDDMLRQEQAVNRPLSKIAVVTDSIADVPRDILDRYQVHVIALKLLWDDEEYLDKLTIRSDQFYSMQQERTSFPGSSLPDEQTVSSVYRYLLEHYESVLVLPVGKMLSGTWNQMQKVAEKFNSNQRRITVIDTCLNSVAQGLLVQEIAKAAAEGASLDDLVSLTEDLKKRIKIYVSVSTFRFMVRGGRVSPLKGFIAKALNLKPIVSLDQTGKGCIMEKAFNRAQLMKKIQRIISRTEAGAGIESFAVVHAADESKAGEFSEMIREVTGLDPAFISEISPLVGMHSGKGALAIGVIEKRAYV